MAAVMAVTRSITGACGRRPATSRTLILLGITVVSARSDLIDGGLMRSGFARAGAIAGLLLLAGLAAEAQGQGQVQWVPGSGQSCDRVCDRARMQPVSSGQHWAQGHRRDHYFVCASNERGHGFRPGYNLRPDWDDVCMVGFGGKEVHARDYVCACQ